MSKRLPFARRYLTQKVNRPAPFSFKSPSQRHRLDLSSQGPGCDSSSSVNGSSSFKKMMSIVVKILGVPVSGFCRKQQTKPEPNPTDSHNKPPTTSAKDEYQPTPSSHGPADDPVDVEALAFVNLSTGVDLTEEDDLTRSTVEPASQLPSSTTKSKRPTTPPVEIQQPTTISHGPADPLDFDALAEASEALWKSRNQSLIRTVTTPAAVTTPAGSSEVLWKSRNQSPRRAVTTPAGSSEVLWKSRNQSPRRAVTTRGAVTTPAGSSEVLWKCRNQSAPGDFRDGLLTPVVQATLHAAVTAPRQRTEADKLQQIDVTTPTEASTPKQATGVRKEKLLPVRSPKFPNHRGETCHTRSLPSKD